MELDAPIMQHKSLLQSKSELQAVPWVPVPEDGIVVVVDVVVVVEEIVLVLPHAELEIHLDSDEQPDGLHALLWYI